MKKLLTLTAFWVLIALNASAQYFQWARPVPDSTNGTSIAAGSNSLAVAGQFHFTATLGNQTFTSTGGNNSYLALYDLSGNVLWAKHIITHSFNRPRVTLDQNQNIIVSGSFLDSLYIDGLLFKGTVPNAGGVYIAKFSPTGNLIWARSSTIAAGLQGFGTSVSTDASGNIYMGGTFQGTLTFGTTTFNSSGPSKAYIVKYDANGNLQWLKGSTIGSIQAEAKVKATANGDVYFAYLNNGPLFSANIGLILLKLNAGGTQIWNNMISTQPGTVGGVTSLDLTTDNANNVYVTGNFTQSIIFTNMFMAWTLNAGLNNKGLFLAKFTAAGMWKWAKHLASGNYNAEAPSIYYDVNNKLAISGSYSGAAVFGSSMNQPLAKDSLQKSFITGLDTAGFLNWTNVVNGTSGNFNSALTGDAAGHYYISGSYHTGSAHFNSQALNTNAGVEGYLAKVVTNANEVSGTIFQDMNNNGLKDTNELPFEDLILSTSPNPLQSISTANGVYKFYLPPGSFNINIPNPPQHYTVVPGSQSVTFSGSNQVQSGKDFALQPIPNQTDVRVTVTNLTPARPGFVLRYRLTFKNLGTVPLSDSIFLAYNGSNLTFTSATTAPAVQQTGQLKWGYLNLLPNEKRDIDIAFTVATAAVLGTNLQAMAVIKPFDPFGSDNLDTLNHIITASYDPNDKQVDKPFLTPAQLATAPYLDYIIRFQNMGTDTAFTVVVTDQLSTKLNLGTLEILSASHPYKMTVTNNRAEWRFDNILLPHSTRNEPASHGFIRYRIKPKTSLLLGDSITNQAAIFFDFNTPVMTNYAVTKISSLTGIKVPETSLSTFRLYPNPASNFVTIASEFKKPTSATVRLVNMLGQTISEVALPATNQLQYQLFVSKLAKGVYIIQLETEAGRQTQRLVVQ